MAELGLSLAEAKHFTAALQAEIVPAQMTALGKGPCACEACGRRLASKGSSAARFRSLFGDVPVRVRRWLVCPCQSEAKSVAVIDFGRGAAVAPEFAYVMARYAPLVPFGKAAALFCTMPQTSPTQVLSWFVQRWQLEVTFEETRAHFCVETERQWSDRAIARTTPCLLGLFSLAAQLRTSERRTVATTAWYHKSQPTFSDTLALVRRHIWREQGFLMSRRNHNVAKPKPALQKAIIYALCNAA